jgi:hypothetical protein
MRRGQDNPLRGDDATSQSLRPPHERVTRGPQLRDFPTSLLLGGVVLVPMAVTQRWPRAHPWLQRWFASSWDRWRVGQIWRLFTSTFVQGGPGLVAGVLILLLLLPIAEWRIGSGLTAIVFLAGDWLSSVTVMLGARVGAALGSSTATHVLHHLDSGASAACYACAGAGLALLRPGRWRRVLASLLLADLVIEAVVTHMVAEIQHPIAVLVGVALALRADSLLGVERRDATRCEGATA